MKKVFYYLVAIFFTINNMQASSINSCKLPKNEYLLIGCTKKCVKTYKQAILKTAKELKYNIKFKDFNHSDTNYNTILSQVDGIISPGGHDIEPKYYTKLLNKEEKKKVEIAFKKYGKTNYKGKVRDKFEYGLFKEYIANDEHEDLPVVGICYGMQMLSAVKEIPLYVDISTDIGIPARRKINDTISFREKSNLNKYLKNGKVTGYKNHHQAINLKSFDALRKKGKFKNVSITGVSNQGKIAEILELKNRPAIGVQFHPERSSQTTRKAIFSYFLVNACNRKINSKITKSYEKVYNNSTTIDEYPLEDIKYALTINTTPSNAKVFITNIIPKYKNGIRLKGGTYNIKIKKNGYITKIFQINLNDNKIYDIALNRLKSKKIKDTLTSTIANETNYYIQVGSFKGKPSQRFIKIIKNNNFPYIISDGSNGMKRLLIGSFKSKKSAKDALVIVRDLITKEAFILN